MPHFFKAEDRPRERYFEARRSVGGGVWEGGQVCDAEPGYCPGVGAPRGGALEVHEHRSYVWGKARHPYAEVPDFPQVGYDFGDLIPDLQDADMSAERCIEEVRLLEAERSAKLSRHLGTALALRVQDEAL